RAAAIIAEREAGEVGTGLMRLFGARPRPALAAHTSPQAFVAPEPEVSAVADTPELGLTQTEADIEATDHFLTTAPRSRVNARPRGPTPAHRLALRSDGGWDACCRVRAPCRGEARYRGPCDGDSEQGTGSTTPSCAYASQAAGDADAGRSCRAGRRRCHRVSC